VRNHQQDGFAQATVPAGRTNYHPSSVAGALQVGPGFTAYPECVDGPKERKRSETFADHYGQATLFWNSMSEWEQEHIIAAYRFELGKVTEMPIRVRAVEHLNRIDHDLAVAVARGVGVEEPVKSVDNHGRRSPALSLAAHDGAAASPRTRRVAVLVADGADARIVGQLRDALTAAGATADLLAHTDGSVTTSDGLPMEVTRALTTTASVLYDAVVVPSATADLSVDGAAVHFAAEAYKHGKPVGAFGTGLGVLQRAQIPLTTALDDPALVVAEEFSADFPRTLLTALSAHRNFDRDISTIPA
jgi:catalase